MLTELDKAFDFLQEMKRRHQFVSQRTGALHQACEQLVEEEVCACIHLVNVHICRGSSWHWLLLYVVTDVHLPLLTVVL